MLSNITYDGMPLEYAALGLKADTEIVLAVVTQNGRALIIN